MARSVGKSVCIRARRVDVLGEWRARGAVNICIRACLRDAVIVYLYGRRRSSRSTGAERLLI